MNVLENNVFIYYNLEKSFMMLMCLDMFFSQNSNHEVNIYHNNLQESPFMADELVLNCLPQKDEV